VGAFFIATNFQKIWFPNAPLEINVRNEIPEGNILAGTDFKVISRGTYFIARISTGGLFPGK
jgi:hypothetical protein